MTKRLPEVEAHQRRAASSKKGWETRRRRSTPRYPYGDNDGDEDVPKPSNAGLWWVLFLTVTALAGWSMWHTAGTH